MRPIRLTLLSCLFAIIVFIAACRRDKLSSVSETPPPDKGPSLGADAALRPNYQFAGKAPVAAGTAFVVADKGNRLYMLTAAHVMDNDAEWQSVQGVELKQMGGGTVAKVSGRPVFIGKPFDKADTDVDLVIWPLAADAKATPLKLAAGDVSKNEWCWAVGQEPGQSGPSKMYRCKVTGTDHAGLSLEQHDKFQMRGFSGGPLVNAQGEVVGSVLGGNGATMITSRVSTIRKRLTEAGVDVP